MKCNQCGAEYEGNFCPPCGVKAEAEAPRKDAQEQSQAENRETVGQTVQPEPIKPQKKKKPFYLRWWFILIAILAVGITALSVGGKKSENFCGTYKVDHVEYNGSDYSLEQLKSLGKDFSSVCLILNNSNKAYFCFNDEIQESSWVESDNNIMLGTEKHPIVDDTICLESDDFKLYLKKASNIQTIPKQKNDITSSTEQNTDSATSSSTKSEASIPTESSKPVESSKPAESSSKPADSNLVNGMHKDFKESMDSYEKFMDEYVAFMKKYKANPTDLGLLADYATFMSKYADMVDKFDKWESEDLNTTELAYYLDVQTRVTKKLLEVAN